jgi:hypothetical protein
MRKPDNQGGTQNWATVKSIFIDCSGLTPGHTMYIDRLFLDVCPSVPVKKVSMEFYLDNTAEETASPNVIYDETFNWVGNEGVNIDGPVNLAYTTAVDETTIVIKGSHSAKNVVTSGSACSYSGDAVQFASDHDWSGYNFLCFYLYGSNDGGQFAVRVRNLASTNSFLWKFSLDNWTGWRRIILPLKKTSPDSSATTGWWAVAGSIDWAHVGKIHILSNKAKTFYVDRVVLDVGTWAKCEISVPDVLHNHQNYLSKYSTGFDDPSYWGVYFWNGSAYVAGTYWDTALNAQKSFVSDQAKYLDSSSLQNVWGETQTYLTQNCLNDNIIGQQGETKYRAGSYGNESNIPITYSQVGTTKKRIGFCLKMPPSDLRQSSTYGISQARLKLEAYAP